MRTITVILLSLFANVASALTLEVDSTKLAPDYYTFQMGGYAGFGAAGIGYDWTNRLATSLSIGYVPKELAGADIGATSLKNTYRYARFYIDNDRLYPYVGLGMLYNPDKDLFVLLPGRYPAGYYEATAIRYTLHSGLLLDRSDYRLFIEWTYHDVELTRYASNASALQFTDLGSIAIGYQLETK